MSERGPGQVLEPMSERKPAQAMELMSERGLAQAVAVLLGLQPHPRFRRLSRHLNRGHLPRAPLVTPGPHATSARKAVNEVMRNLIGHSLFHLH